MSLIVRIDVDRPYGRRPLLRHMLSRLSSDLYFPKVQTFGYLTELDEMLGWLNSAGAHAYVFFRRCTLPFASTIDLLNTGGHTVGLHLENSRSIATFQEEKQILERHFGMTITAVSKHGSGGATYGFHHYAPYEPEKYVVWAQRSSMHVLFGNLEDPTLRPLTFENEFVFYPSAFWLEPAWRDTKTFTVDWLLEQAKTQDIVLLVHPENVLADPALVSDFKRLITSVNSQISRSLQTTAI